MSHWQAQTHWYRHTQSDYLIPASSLRSIWRRW